MSIELPKLPYAMDALKPFLSAETLEYHYGKHHNAYVVNLNKLTSGTKYEKLSLEDIIKQSEGPVFNNAAQIWNHTFYWNCLTPKAGGEPSARLAKALDQTFGSVAKFKELFGTAAKTVFGSGWAFLVQNKEGKLEIVQKPNAGTPLTDGVTPLLTCDVWEHAYYVDYRNERPRYVDAFWNQVNWGFVDEHMR